MGKGMELAAWWDVLFQEKRRSRKDELMLLYTRFHWNSNPFQSRPSRHPQVTVNSSAGFTLTSPWPYACNYRIGIRKSLEPFQNPPSSY